MNNVLFKTNEKKDADLSISKSILEKLISMSFNVYVINPDLLRDDVKLYVKEENPNLDFALILGGDGTILRFSREYADLELPILGINLGRVGALANLELNNYESYLELVKQDKFIIENRLTLEGKVYRGKKKLTSFSSINDISVANKRSTKMISLDIRVNNRLKTQFYADSVVVSTPSGSSAYSMAGGGPLLLPETKAYVLTPICPQFKAFNSVVLEEKDKLDITTSASNAIINIDGSNTIEFTNKDVLKIRKSHKKLKMIAFDEQKDLYESVYKVAMSIYKD